MTAHQKVAVITGASRGIGAGLVEGFLNRNYLVVANSRSIETRASAEVLTVAGDVADPKTVDRIVSGARSKAAGSSDFTPFWSGQAASLGRALPARELTRLLAAEALEILEAHGSPSSRARRAGWTEAR
jgi:NAD(P)-dependent dehydrogenase (short-subunit alcohol dehydrogenase family)